MYISNITA